MNLEQLVVAARDAHIAEPVPSEQWPAAVRAVLRELRADVVVALSDIAYEDSEQAAAAVRVRNLFLSVHRGDSK